MGDTLEVFGTEYTNVAGFKATDDNDTIKTYIRPQGTLSITENGDGIDVTSYASVDVDVSGGAGAFVDVVEQLVGGGDHHIITGVDISSDTVTAAHLEQGYTAHDASGNAVVGTLVAGGGSSTLITKNITANGTYNASSDNADGYSSVTVNVEGGGASASQKQINFIDYDGTILYSYSKTEWQNISTLPSNPSHSGLTAQGWNWTKAQIDARLTAMPSDVIWVGQMYITDSGDTEIDVRFADSARLSPILTIAVNGTATVDWGDNTTADTVTGASLTTMQAVPHEYASIGNYTITIHVVSGSFRFYSSDNQHTLLRKTTLVQPNRVYANCVQAVRFGSGVTSIGTYAFQQCHSLASITIPSSVTSIENYAFYSCLLTSITIPSAVTSIGTYAFYAGYSLTSIAIPSAVTSIGTYAFYNVYSLTSITMPSSLISIGGRAFYGCYSLASITIPSSVTDIAAYAFYLCAGMAEYHILPTTPPILENTNVFNSIESDCKIYVPSASLSNYQTASNWSTYASYMIGE